MRYGYLFKVVLFVIVSFNLYGCERSFEHLAVVSDADITAFILHIGKCDEAIVKWRRDMGRILPLTKEGEFTTSGDSNFELQLMEKEGTKDNWAKWHGPYLELFLTPPFFSNSYLWCGLGMGYDLDGDNKSDGDSSMGAVELNADDVNEQEWRRIDNALDTGIGKTDEEKKEMGRVRWTPSHMWIYIAHEK